MKLTSSEYGLPEETMTAIIVLNKKALVSSPDGDTEFKKIVAEIFQGDTSAPYYLPRLSPINIIRSNKIPETDNVS